MRYFITGGGGFVGSALAEQLLQDGHSVTAFTLKSTALLKSVASNPHFSLVHGDALDRGAVERAMKGHEFVFHFAANPDVKKAAEHPELELVSIRLTFNVLEAMRKNGINRIAFSSSATVYGNASVVPTPEDYGPLLPISLYGASKLAGEALISGYCGTFGMTAWIFRFANLVGGAMTHGIILDLLAKLQGGAKQLEVLGDGKQERAYLHISDCITGMLTAIAASHHTGADVYNLAGTTPISVKDVAELVLAGKGLDVSNVHYSGSAQGWKGDVRAINLDTGKLRSLGWKQSMNSEQAVRSTIREMLGKN